MKKVMLIGCILSLLVPALVLVGCGSGGSSSGTPEQVAKAFYKAAMTGDASTAWSKLSKSVQANMNKADWSKAAVTNSLGNGTIEVGKATITGNTATVPVKIMNGATEIMTSNVQLVEEGGVWKVQMP